MWLSKRNSKDLQTREWEQALALLQADLFVGGKDWQSKCSYSEKVAALNFTPGSRPQRLQPAGVAGSKCLAQRRPNALCFYLILCFRRCCTCRCCSTSCRWRSSSSASRSLRGPCTSGTGHLRKEKKEKDLTKEAPHCGDIFRWSTNIWHAVDFLLYASAPCRILFSHKIKVKIINLHHHQCPELSNVGAMVCTQMFFFIELPL